LDIPQAEKTLKGVVLEIDDGAYPLLNSVQTGSDPKVLFKDLDVGVFIGGFPRKQGMERKELLTINGKIFKGQGEALNEVAKPTCRVLVVANPANTNCTILQNYCPNIPKENFTALTRLDHNRAISQIANKCNVHSSAVKGLCIWGNHSSTQYPDVNHGTVNGKPVREVVNDDAYLNGDFISRVQKRGAEVIDVRGGSSVFSAANGAKDHLRDWFLGCDWTSMAVMTDGKSYNVPAGLCYSFPVKCLGNWKYEIVQGLKIDEFSQQKMDATTKELQEEKADALG
jgi:malate dehydrogenase